MNTFIIAEIGINHNGDIKICKKLIDIAKNSGCDAVKFQKRTLNKVYTEEQLLSHRDSPWGNTTYDQKNGLEFGLNYLIEDSEISLNATGAKDNYFSKNFRAEKYGYSPLYSSSETIHKESALILKKFLVNKK